MIDYPLIVERKEQVPGTLFPSGFRPMSDEDIFILQKTNDAIKITEDCIIAQLHARSIKEFLELVNWYQTLANGFKDCECFLRGQTAIYFDKDGYMKTLPAALRPAAKGTPFHDTTNSKDFTEQIYPWTDQLGNALKIDIGNCLKYLPMEMGEDYGIARFQTPSVYTGKFSSEFLEAIMQHYGFPTYSLDVTRNPLVAAWFALNKGEIKDKVIKFSPKKRSPFTMRTKAESPEALASVSSVLIYIQQLNNKEYPIMDLGKNKDLIKIAIRPKVQEALSMPCVITSEFREPYGLQIHDHNCIRCPAAVIKLYFDSKELLHLKPDLTADYLLPIDDYLYQSMLQANLPHLAVYYSKNKVEISELKKTKIIRSNVSIQKKLHKPRKKDLQGSIHENPRAIGALSRSRKVLKEAGITVNGSGISKDQIIFIIDDHQEVPPKVRAELDLIGKWGNVYILCCKRNNTKHR